MWNHASITFVLVALLAEGALPAATKPQAVHTSEATQTWTNEDLERLRKTPDSISVVGPPANESQQNVDAHSLQPETRDPSWYAAQSASLNARLESEEADLRDFEQKLEDAQEFGTTTAGINLDQSDPGVTPEATVEILQSRVRETQSELDALEDLARQNGVPPGILRGQ